MSLFKSGYLKMHERSNTARIILSNGTNTQFLVTKRQALEIGEALVGISIEIDEWLAIREQIHSSSLTSHNSDLEKICNQLQNDFGELIRQVEQFMKSYNESKSDGDEWKK